MGTVQSEIKELVREAFKAGFMSAGEGWNGEYPFERGVATDEDHSALEERFRRFYTRKRS